MKYDFDEKIDRRNTDCLKYDFAAERGKPYDALPLWVADMDFRTAPGIIERVAADAVFGIYGYTESKDDYFQAVANWYQTYFDWTVEKQWLVKTPGVVFAIGMAVQALTKEGDAVMIQQPVYYPFSEVIRDNNRRLINNALVLRDGHYEIDFEDFERKIREEKVKLFVLCSPHNPVGRVWTKEELLRLGNICGEYGVKVVSDEIHSDFVYEGRKHYVFSTVAPDFGEFSVICTAPSKTFNMAGLQVSNIFIPNAQIRKAFLKQMSAAGYSQINMIGLHACKAAYETGREWLEELKKYLKGNLDFVKDYLENNLPQVRLIEPEGTYLIWLDFRGLGLTEAQRKHLILHEAGLWLDSGVMFGKEGEGFERVNIACPRAVLEEACKRLAQAVKRPIS
ncbi:MAG: pyridoxal phosphate-dependent aminotransferase [Clostridiales bacterium]|nr:pyridoxal phosphate-dependent aminotransferase [Clostridiales bacterium]